MHEAFLGDALYEPLPLVPAAHRQGPFRLALERTEAGPGDWNLVHDPAGWFAGMAWSSKPVEMDAFAERHRWFSTSPESTFVKFLVVLRRDATGVDILRGLSLKRIGEGAAESTLATGAELTDVLGDLFGLDVDGLGHATRTELWEKVHRTHLAREAAGSP